MEEKLIPALSELDRFIDSDDEVLLLSEAIKKMGDDTSRSYSVGFKAIDDLLNGGFSDGDLVVISGKTGMGKTTFAQTLTYHFCKQGLPCLWFSYEVILRDLWNKFKAMGIEDSFLTYSPFKMTSGKLDWVEYKIKEAVLKYKTKIVFIDHLGFLLPKVSYGAEMNKNYAAYLGMICRQLKQTAIEYNIIVVLCAHLRKTDDPNIDDLRDSSAIAQEADSVFIVNRKKQEKKKYSLEQEGEIYTNETKISLEKNRKTGNLKYIYCTFANGKFSEVTNNFDDHVDALISA